MGMLGNGEGALAEHVNNCQGHVARDSLAKQVQRIFIIN